MNTQTNTVVADAVERLNQQNSEAAQQEAVRLMNCINDKQDKKQACEGRISELRQELGKVASTVIDETSVFGGSLPANANRDTILKVLEKANKDRQYSVETASDRLQKAIVSEQDAIVMLDKAVAELREKIVKIEVPTVSVTQIMG